MHRYRVLSTRTPFPELSGLNSVPRSRRGYFLDVGVPCPDFLLADIDFEVVVKGFNRFLDWQFRLLLWAGSSLHSVTPFPELSGLNSDSRSRGRNFLDVEVPCPDFLADIDFGVLVKGFNSLLHWQFRFGVGEPFFVFCGRLQ
ncbi:hypothetical protein CEXT_4271 [Caerostris extrusa]|uniref:Uncharacterized protein n=1 Tax=Caerostris extrusa TaxID=172846 RepID=A0AAV4NAT9_CAEEX|nr:hypothetical protein CEXT_4271 [Caerostris extrusa]